jgi:hypothetical protein
MATVIILIHKSKNPLTAANDDQPASKPTNHSASQPTVVFV